MNTPEQQRLNPAIERVLQTLRKGVRSKTTYFDITVPNPKPNTLVFHQATYFDGFVTLQAETKILDGRITIEQVERIFETLTKVVKIENNRNSARIRGFVNIFFIIFGVLCLGLPVVLFFPFDTIGVIIGIVVYVIGMVGLGFIFFYQ